MFFSTESETDLSLTYCPLLNKPDYMEKIKAKMFSISIKKEVRIDERIIYCSLSCLNTSTINAQELFQGKCPTFEASGSHKVCWKMSACSCCGQHLRIGKKSHDIQKLMKALKVFFVRPESEFMPNQMLKSFDFCHNN